VAVSEQGWVPYARDFVEDSRAHGEGWPDIVVDLRGEGIEEEVIAEVLRENQAWVEDAREWKQHGYPYDLIVQYLRDEVAAPWDDVAHALMEVGMSPADMLRVTLPLVGDDSPVPVMRAALLEGSEDFDGAEAWEVTDYYFPGVKECELVEPTGDPGK
jgi:hypothetical protein